MKKSIKIRKYSGELVDFDEKKLIMSLKNAQADHDLAHKIVDKIEAGAVYGNDNKGDL